MRDFKREGYWERQWNRQGHTVSSSWRKSPNKRFPVSLSISRRRWLFRAACLTPIKPALGLMPPHRTQHTAARMMAEDRVRGLPVQTSRHGHTRTGLRSVCSHSHTDAAKHRRSSRFFSFLLIHFYCCCLKRWSTLNHLLLAIFFFLLL